MQLNWSSFKGVGWGYDAVDIGDGGNECIFDSFFDIEIKFNLLLARFPKNVTYTVGRVTLLSIQIFLRN